MDFSVALLIGSFIDSQVIEPMEKDKGMYSIVITNPENSNKRKLDLSGDGQYLYLLTLFIDNTVKTGVETTQSLVFMELLASICSLRLSSDIPTL